MSGARGSEMPGENIFDGNTTGEEMNATGASEKFEGSIFDGNFSDQEMDPKADEEGNDFSFGSDSGKDSKKSETAAFW